MPMAVPTTEAQVSIQNRDWHIVGGETCGRVYLVLRVTARGLVLLEAKIM